MRDSAVVSSSVIKVNLDHALESDDFLAAEEPLEIRLHFGKAISRKEKSISITMRTPGNDAELAAGFLFTEGIIKSYRDIADIRHSSPGENKIVVELGDAIEVDLKKLERHFYTTSSCGVCGKSSMEAVRTISSAGYVPSAFQTEIKVIYRLPELLRQQQNIFESTGGLHASALFDPSGNLSLLREDVGRHNALDKLIGAALENELIPLSTHLLLLSGRASFELIQKAAMAGIQFVCAVGAPSSLAVELAKEFDMTLIGFLRNERFNIYCGEKRIQNLTAELHIETTQSKKEK